jgi:hypothetical protein
LRIDNGELIIILLYCPSQIRFNITSLPSSC